MADFSNIPTGLKITTQIPLDVKEYIQNESLLSNLGVNGQLAYTYTKGLVVYCIEESTRWEWIEVKPGLEDTGLINQDFIYSDNHIAFGIDYSNKRYNFFPYNQSTFTVPDATTTIKGILKLANDLGGTADAPTTPTALHKTGREAFTGLKTAISTDIERASISMQNDSNTNSLLRIVNYATAPNNTNGAEFYNNINSGSAIYVESSGSGAGILARITQGSSNTNVIKVDITSISSINDGCVYNASTSSNLTNHLAFKVNNVNVATVSKNGNITANSYIKTGGTSTQMLMADGSVKENQDNLQKEITTSTVILDIDNNSTTFINNGATPITITIDSSITTPNFCVGFIQEGTGDVTFVGTGVSLTNPVGLKSKGQGYQTFIERKLATSTYFLLGNTRA